MTGKTLTTTKGRSIDTPYTDDEAIKICRTLSGDFARELMTKLDTYKELTPDQMVWVHIMVVGKTKPNMIKGLDLSKLVDLLENASNHLKSPAILIRVNPDTFVKISFRRDGVVRVVDTRRTRQHPKHGAIPVLYGTIKDGRYQPSGYENAPEGLTAALKAMSDDPVKAASDYGRMTGVCCFCSNALSDGRSVTVGYGPICAHRYGLPWGGSGNVRTSKEKERPDPRAVIRQDIDPYA